MTSDATMGSCLPKKKEPQLELREHQEYYCVHFQRFFTWRQYGNQQVQEQHFLYALRRGQPYITDGHLTSSILLNHFN